jgi:hypothetical protein
MSKHPDFSEEQNAALRAALLTLEGSHADIGRDLGIAHQNVGRLRREDGSGFSYRTASRLVRLVGFEGVDAFFAARGCPVPVPTPADSSAELLEDDTLHARAAG